MDIVRAQQIVSEYQAVIAKGAIRDTVLRKISWLPCSKGMIKYAYYVLIEKSDLTDRREKELAEEYSLLEYFVTDDLAEKYAKNYEEWQVKKTDPFKNKKDESMIKQYLAYSALLRARSDESRSEINTFFSDLHLAR